jgi:hypothetical protein
MSKTLAINGNQAALGNAKDLNARDFPNVDAFTQRAAAKPAYYIFNIYPQSYSKSLGSLGSYYLPACAEGEEYSKPLVINEIVITYTDQGEGRLGFMTDEGLAVAANILGCEYRNGEWLAGPHYSDLRDWGCFVSTSETPTAKELTEAKTRLRRKMEQLVAKADQKALEGNEGLKEIDAIHRKAAHYLNVSRTWATLPVQMDGCPACGSQVKPGVAICPHCTAVLDEAKARAFFPERFARIDALTPARK